MLNKIDYIINKKSETQYEVHKFLYGKVANTYKIDTLRNGRKCSCLAGIYRGTCKHEDWVLGLKKKQKLPDNVEISRAISKKELQAVSKI